LTEVAALAGVTWQAVISVVEVFRRPRRRFLTPSLDKKLERDDVIDISHESLIRQWQRLRAWAEDERWAAGYYRRLEEAAVSWDKGEGSLWRALDLERALDWQTKVREIYISSSQFENWVRRYGEQLDGEQLDLAMEFLKASKKAQEEEKRQEENQRRQEEIQRQKLKRVREQMWWAISAAVFTTIFAGWGFWERNQALSAKSQLEQLEQARTTDLFDSQRTHAALIAQQEDYAAAKQLLNKTFGLDPDVDASHRYARDLLARFNDLMGGTPQQDYKGAKAALYATAISPDGLTLAVAGENGTVVLFDAKTGQLVQRLQGHTANVKTVLFHPQGKWLATAGDDKQIIRWSFPKGEKLKAWTAPDKVWTLAMNPDGTRLASGGEDKNISVWEAETGQLLNTFTGHEGEIAGLAFNLTGELLASASFDKTARVWQVNTGQVVSVLSGHTDKVQNLTFSSDGQLLATGSNDKTLRLWQVKSGQTERVFNGHKNTIYGLTFTPDGRYLISSSADNTLRIWETGSGVTVRILQGHTATVTGVTLHGQQLFSASNDGTAKRWDTTLPYQVSLDLPSEPASTAIAPDGSRVAVGFADGSLRLYSLPLGEGKAIWEQSKVHQRDIQRLAFSADGTLLASASLDTTVKLWQVKEGQLLQTLSGHKQGVSAAAFSPTRTTLVTVSYDGQLGVFKVGSPAPQFYPAYEGPPEEINAVTFDATGQKLLTTSDHTVRLWNFENEIPKLGQTYPKTDEDLLWATLSPDGQRYVTGGRKFVAQVYATANSQLQYSLVGHEESILRAAFSPDNQQLATISGDATVRFWDLTNGSELFTLRLPTNSGKPEPLWDFDFRCTPTGCWLVVPLTRGKLVVYELGKIYP
jgi:WD40 repeat protein